MIEGSCDFKERRSSLYATALPGLVTIGIVVVEMFLISHVNSRDYVFKGLCDLMDWSFLWQVTNFPSFVAIALAVVVIQQLQHFIWPFKKTWSKDLVTLWKGNPLLYISTLPKLIAIDIVLMDI